MEILNTGAFDWFSYQMWLAEKRSKQLPKPLPWIEPSINMPFLQACASYVLGECLGSIFLTAGLLEHALRLAVIDQVAGKQGSMDEKLWSKYSWFSINDFFQKEQAIVAKVIGEADAEWWVEVAAKVIRNKTLHLDVPAILQKLGTKDEYMGTHVLGLDKELFSDRFWWGAIFHRLDCLVSRVFLTQATEQLAKLSENMGWQPDRSHWSSQESDYNSFFQYPWTMETMAKSLETFFKSRRIIEVPESGKPFSS